MAADEGQRRRRGRVERSACPTCGSCSGMFTANSMNCLTEALGLSLPGNGTVVATHADREQLFLRAGRLIVELCPRYYEQDDAIGAAALDRRLQGVRERDDAGHRHGRLHQHHPAPAGRRAGGREVDFTMADIDRLSRACRSCARWRPTPTSTTSRTCTAPAASWPSWASSTAPAAAHRRAHRARPDAGRRAGPVGHRAHRTGVRRPSSGRPGRHPHAGRVQPGHALAQPGHRPRRRLHPLDGARLLQEGGLAVLHGNIARDGCVVKTAGVDESILVFEGPAHVDRARTRRWPSTSWPTRSRPATW
jgi:dihydroxy-acid dehydratase